MRQRYPLQVIALDTAAHQSIDLAELARFDKTIKAEIGQLPQLDTQGYRQIIVLSEFDADILDRIEGALSKLEEPIVLLPEQSLESKALKRLVLGDIRIFFASSDNLQSFALAHILKILETLFYCNDEESEVTTDYDDLYTVIGRGTITRCYEGRGSNLPVVTMETLNIPEGFKEATGVVTLFEIDANYPMLDVADALDLIEKRVPEECSLLFETRATQKDPSVSKLTCLVSRYVSYFAELQREIDRSETYFGKLAVIVDAFADGTLTGEEADFLANVNAIDKRDIEAIYTIVFTTTEELSKLMRMLRNTRLSTFEREAYIADMVKERTVDTGLLKEIILTHGLSLDRVAAMVELKNEGKLPINLIDLPDTLKERYPQLRLATASGTILLLTKEGYGQDEKSGLLYVTIDDLHTYEHKDTRIYYDKRLESTTVQAFLEAYEAIGKA
jgi:hypothetical protein